MLLEKLSEYWNRSFWIYRVENGVDAEGSQVVRRQSRNMWAAIRMPILRYLFYLTEKQAKHFCCCEQSFVHSLVLDVVSHFETIRVDRDRYAACD